MSFRYAIKHGLLFSEACERWLTIATSEIHVFLKPTGQRVFTEYELYQELQLEGMGMTQARKRAGEA